jgi:uncharacterized repeat protein (TIGR01451 family)
MKPLLRLLGLLLAWATLLRPGSVQAQNAGAAFSCDGTFYQVRQAGGGTTGIAASSVLYRVNRATTPYTTSPVTGGTFGTTGTLNVSGTNIVVNALAYNSQDGYLYALTYPADNAATTTVPRLYKIGQGGVQDLGATTLPNTGQFATGAFDKTGHYYVTTRNSTTNAFRGNLYRFDLNSSNTTPLTASVVGMRNATGGAVTNTATEDYFDIAYDPIDNKLYGVFNDNILYRLDLYDAAGNPTSGNTSAAAPAVTAPATARITQLGTTAGTQVIGTAFFDIAGKLFAYANGTVGNATSGTFYLVNTTTGAYTTLSSIEGVSNSDGASCINPEQRIDVTKELTNVVAVNTTTFNVTYTIRVRNTGTVTDENVQVSDFLSGTGATTANTTFPTATSTTIITAPTVTNLDGSALSANAGFTGKNGAASLLDGTQDLTAGQRAIITYTVQVVFPAGQVPTTAQNNTAYATSTGGTAANNGYTQATADGSLVTPNALEANDASTNSSEFPLLRADLNDMGDTPTPTPLVFAPSISGTVFEDVNYGGGLGRSQSSSNGIGRGNVRVELYTVAAGVATYNTFQTTAADGSYSFTGLTAGNSYVVRVVNSGVTSSRGTGGVAVQTYRTTVTATGGTIPDLNRVGGEDPSRDDAGNGAALSTLTTLNVPTTGTTIGTIAESQAPVTLPSAGPAVNVDFGYNFDVIVNNNDAGQGSFRQFVINSNALGGETTLAQVYTSATGAATALTPGVETSIFMLSNGTAVAGQRAGLTSEFATTTGTSTAATITLSSTIAGGITGPLTVIDGSTQTRSTGNTNAAVATAGSESTGPEVIINFNGFDGLTTSAASTSLLNMGLTGATPAGGSNTAAFSILAGGTNAVVQNNTFYTNGANLRITSVGGAVISNNISRSALSSNSDGIEVTSSSNNTITNNQFLNNAGYGIDFIAGTSTGNTISGNTFSTNGQNTSNGQNAGIGFRTAGASNNTVSNNIFTNNLGDGISASDGTNNVFSQNSFSNNGNLAIDLAPASTANFAGDGVTVNDLNDADTGANGLTNFPILTTANVGSTNLVLNGYARPGAVVELYLAAADPTGFGEGQTYLTSFTQAAAAGTTGNVATTAATTYGPAAINGLSQGTDNTLGFTVTIPLASLTAAQRTALLSNAAVLTSTATIASVGTSEFSGNIALPIVDVTTALTGPQTVSPGQPTGTYTATFANQGPSTAANVTRTVTLPAGATNILVNGVAYTPSATMPNTIDFGTAATLASGTSNAFTFSFTPATTATGTVAITSNVTTSTSQGNNVAPDASTITAPVVPVANVATTLVATTPSVAAGALATAKFTATFSNGGPNAAAGVVASVQLPVGLTNVTYTNNPNGVYSPATGILTFPDLTSLTATGSTSSIITFDAPASGPLVASSTISTTTNEAGQTANNQASATIAVTPAFDLTTTLTGPASAVAGDLVTLNVTTTNNGPAAAANAVQTVQLATGLTNVYVSNGGVYNPLTTTQTIIANGVSYLVPAGGVIFPTLASLANGQTVANSISFSMPGTAFAPTALVTPNTASTATTAGDTNTGNNTANLNAGTAGTNLTVATPLTGTANEYTTIRTSAASTTVGSAVTLTVTTGNNGPNQATGVTQTVQVLPGFTTGTIQVNGITGTLNAGVITFGTNGPTYNTTTGIVTFPTLANGAAGSASATSVTNTITLTPSAATPTTVATTGNNGQLLAMATVRTTNTDPVAADNVASVAITLAASADLVTTITGPTTAQAGQAVTYTASFVNNGPLAASGVTETAQLPAGLGTNGVTITDAAGNTVSGAAYNSITGLVTFPALTTVANGATQVFKLTFAAPAQSFTPRSSVASTSTDAVATNNSASVATSVAAAADLATIINGPATAVVGNAVTYTVTTTNNGPLAAANAVTTLQLAAGFNASTLRVNGTTGVLGANNTITYTFGTGAATTTATYNTATGLVTFPAVASLANGTSAGNYVTFVMPNATGGQTTGVASASATGIDAVASNNTASVATSIAPTTTTTTDLVATVSASAASVAPGASVTYTATYSNIGTDAGVNVVPTLQLLPGLTTATLPLVNGGTGTLTNGNITFSNGASYNQQSGVLTFPTIASQATGTAGNVSYSVQVVAPSNGPLLATAATTSNTSEPNTAAAQSNNVQSVPVTITPSFNEVTSISGPATAVAGTSQTYTVTTTNNGPSATSNPTTQTVTVPAGQTPTNITNGGVYSGTANTITWTIAANQPAGSNGAVANSFTIVQPATATTLTATVSVTGESTTAGNAADNTASITTSPLNLAPLAYAMVNTLQNPQSNEAAGLATGLLISPLNASDPEGAFATQKYTIVAAPSAAQGTLYYLNGGTYTAVPLNPTLPLTLTDAQAQTLRFKAATGFVGNASFTYLTTDAAGNTSPVVNYTIPVETDVDAVAYTLTPTKGSANPYVAGDVIAFTTDANAAVYNAATGLVYQDNGTLQPTVAGSAAPASGISAASEVAGSITGPATTSATVLSDIGLAVDAAGRLVVAAAPNTTKLRAGSYSVQILTTDANGGLTTRTVSFVIPAFPLPVVLTAFTATAVANRDAQLSWTTASEVNSAYFNVERSFDGTTFIKVGQLTAKGTTINPTAYAFTDKGVASLATGTVYYRLKQVDLDGKTAYSPVRTVAFTKAAVASLSLYPNPAQQATGLDLSSLPTTSSYQISLLDATGRQVRTLTLGGGAVQPLELTSLASGTYFVLVTGIQADGSPLRQSLRLTKE